MAFQSNFKLRNTYQRSTEGDFFGQSRSRIQRWQKVRPSAEDRRRSRRWQIGGKHLLWFRSLLDTSPILINLQLGLSWFRILHSACFKERQLFLNKDFEKTALNCWNYHSITSHNQEKIWQNLPDFKNQAIPRAGRTGLFLRPESYFQPYIDCSSNISNCNFKTWTL